MRMGQGVRTGLGHGASPVSYRHNFLVYASMMIVRGALRFVSVHLSVHPFVTLYGIEYM